MQNFAIFPLRYRGAVAKILQCSNPAALLVEAPMTPGQRVRVRPASHIAQRKDAAAGEQGTVLCCYKVRGRSAAERLDVRFASNTVMWGVAADQFEPIDGSEAKD